MTSYFVDVEDDDLVVKELNENDEEDIIVSDKYSTHFLLCSARCARKEHFGSFKNNVFTCGFFEYENTHPLNICVVRMKIMEEEL